MLEVSFTSAFLAGLISFVSPCVLPIVPPYLAYLAGVGFSELSGEQTSQPVSRRIVGTAMLFVLGFTTVFVMLGASASLIGQSVARYHDVLAVLAGLVILVMGLHFLGVFRIPLLYTEARIQVTRKPTSLWSAYLIGLAFAFGWTPCVGPVLAAILFVAGTGDTVLEGGLLLATYSTGIGIPFILAALFIRRFLAWANRFKQHMARVEKVMGAMLVLTGVLFLTGTMPVMAYWLLETFPIFATYG